MTRNPNIGPADPGHLDTLKAWLSQAGLPTDDLTVDHLSNFLVLSDRQSPIGMIGLEPCGPVGLLRSLVVARSARGAGAGQQLVDALENLARNMGIDALWLLTIDADPWFARLGYEVRERDDAPQAIRNTREFSGLCPDDAVIMSKSL